VVAGVEHHGLRENICGWIDVRNTVAHWHLPTVDLAVIARAQAGLLDCETVLKQEFGEGLVSHW